MHGGPIIRWRIVKLREGRLFNMTDYFAGLDRTIHKMGSYEFIIKEGRARIHFHSLYNSQVLVALIDFSNDKILDIAKSQAIEKLKELGVQEIYIKICEPTTKENLNVQNVTSH